MHLHGFGVMSRRGAIQAHGDDAERRGAEKRAQLLLPLT